MRLGYDLTIEQSQKMVLSHEMLQSIEILQFTNQELETFLENQVLDNPFLEVMSNSSKRDIISSEGLKEHYLEKDEKEQFSYAGEDDFYSGGGFPKYNWEDKPNLEEYTFVKESLWDYLKQQLGLCKLDELEMTMGLYLIDEINENGYLGCNLEDVAQIYDVDITQVEDVLFVIQTFEPTGVGARNLAECLSIQMCDQGLLKPEINVLLNGYLEDMAQNNIAKVHKDTGIDKEIIKETIKHIKTLNPKPGRAFFTNNDARYITPDVEVKQLDDGFAIKYNERNYPRIRISSYYEQLSKEAEKDPSLKAYMSDKYNNASYLIKAIEQRKETVTRVCNVILEYQRDFFLNGEKYLKPMTLKNVSEKLDIHESTVSRAVHGKFMMMPGGKTIPLKFFFNSGLSSSQGDGVSSKSIKIMIKEIIDHEDPQKPFSDQYIAETLNIQNIHISRRTVAKYREAMGIDSSSKRKRF